MLEAFKGNEQMIEFTQWHILKKIGYLLGMFILLEIVLIFALVIITTNNWAVTAGFLGFIIFYICYSSFMLSLKTLNNHFKMYDLETKTFYFEGEIIYKLTTMIGVFILFFLIFSAYGGPFTGWGIGSVFLFPSIVLFLRRNVFNEKSKNIEEKEANVLGYNPVSYWNYSLICGVLAIGFPCYTLDVFATNPARLIINTIWVIFGFLIVYNYLKPDKWNEKSNFDLRTRKGFEIHTFKFVGISLLNFVTLIVILILMGVQ